MPSRRDPQATIAAHRLFCENRGFYWGAVDYSGDEASVYAEGHGELIELYYRRFETGYWRFDKAYIHGSVTADRVNSWQSVADTMDGVCADTAERMAESAASDYYGGNVSLPSDRPNDPLTDYLRQKGEL